MKFFFPFMFAVLVVLLLALAVAAVREVSQWSERQDACLAQGGVPHRNVCLDPSAVIEVP